MSKRAVIYTRVSTDEQGKGYSLPTQQDACRKYAAEQGYAVVQEFVDEFSGTELERPGLNQLRELVAGGGIDVVIVYDVDRLARNVLFQLQLEKEISGTGVRIEYVLGQYKDTPEGNLLKRIKADIAEYENARRVERSRRGKQGRVQAGYVLVPAGRAPFGYDYKSEKHKGWLIVNEEQAEVIREIYRWLVDDGLSSYAIAKRLWEDGILSKGDFSQVVTKKTGRAEWSPSTIRRMVSNPVYKGVWYYGKTRRRDQRGKKAQVDLPEADWIAVEVPAIVDEASWQLAQERLAENKQRATRNAKREYLLRGLVFCSCGRRWTGRYKNHLHRGYYRCPTTETEHWRQRCSMPGGIRQEILEKCVWDGITEAILDPKTLRLAIERQRAQGDVLRVQQEKRLGQIHIELKEVERKVEILLDEKL